jgi:hypothetical protein
LGVAALIFVWIIIAFILNSLTNFNVFGYHLFTIQSLGGLGVFIQYTITYVVELFILMLILITYTIFPNLKLNIAMLVLLEGIAYLYSLGAV